MKETMRQEGLESETWSSKTRLGWVAAAASCCGNSLGADGLGFVWREHAGLATVLHSAYIFLWFLALWWSLSFWKFIKANTILLTLPTYSNVCIHSTNTFAYPWSTSLRGRHWNLDSGKAEKYKIYDGDNLLLSKPGWKIGSHENTTTVC